MKHSPQSRLSFQLVCAAIYCALAIQASSIDLFVSNAGDDANDGRSTNHAFATISRARDEIRKIKAQGGLPSGGVTVQILGGQYSFTDSLDFTATDSGSQKSPVVYRAYQGEPVQILGGRVLKLSEFTAVSDKKTLARLDSSARSHVIWAPISRLNLNHAGPFPLLFSDSGGIFELFWSGKRLPLSRWPNATDPKDWATMKKAVVNGDNKHPGTFEYREDRPSRWLENRSVWLKGQWRVPWEDPAMRVATIDTTNRTITFAAGLVNGIGNKYTRPFGNGKEPWCAVNLIEEIDQPGEWAIDFDSQTLFLWPPAADGELMVSQLDKPLIHLSGAGHIQFIGLTLESSLGEGIRAEDVESVLIAGCTFRNLAKRAVTIQGYRSGVQSCDFYDLGESCVRIGGGDKLQLISSGNFVLNNHMHHYGVLKAMYSAAVDLSFGGGPNDALFSLGTAVGIRVAQNLIHDAPRDAILVNGQDNIFEYNEIFNCGFQSGDVGAFYSWLDWTIRGVVIRYNYIHDTVGGVNPDDGASGSLVFGNVFAGDRVGVWIASGPDHKIINNIFVKDEGPVFGMDDRGAARGYATNARLLKAVAAIKPTQPPWALRFPEMTNLLASHPELPIRTVFERNLIVMKTNQPFSLKMSKSRQTDTNLFLARDNWVTSQDPGFMDAARGNFLLKPDAKVYQKIPGFEPIPFEKMGLQVDEFRRVLPVDAHSNRRQPSDKGTDKNFGT